MTNLSQTQNAVIFLAVDKLHHFDGVVLQSNLAHTCDTFNKGLVTLILIVYLIWL